MNKKIYLHLSILLFAVIFVWILLTFQIYGPNWDEGFQHEYGIDILRFYTSLFQNRTSMHYFDLYYYGGFFEAIAEIGAAVLPFGTYESRHLVNALFGLWGIIGAFMIGRTFAGNAGGFFSALLMLLFPTYLGHMFNNSKDVPFAAAFLWGIYSIVKGVKKFPEFRFKDALSVGIYCGIASGIRSGGVILYFYFLLAWVFYSAYQFIINRIDYKTALKWQLDFIKRLPVLIVIAYITMAVFWPWLQKYPITAIPDSLHHYMTFHGTGDPMYIPSYYLVKFPEWIFILTFAGLLLLALWIIKQFKTKTLLVDIKTLTAWLVLFTSFFFTSLYPVLLSSTFYNEIRQMIFGMVPLIVICGITAALLLEKIDKIKWLKAAYFGLFVAFSALYIYEIASLYPYHYSYFNRFAGRDLAQALQHYVGGDYYEFGNKELFTALIKHIKEKEGPDLSKKIRLICLRTPGSPTDPIREYLHAGNFAVTNCNSAQYILNDKSTNGTLIYSIVRQGVVFEQVRER